MGNDPAERQGAQKPPLTVDDKHLIGMVGKSLKATQEAHHDADRDFLPDRQHLKVHARANAILGIAHGRAQLCALFVREAFLDFGDNVCRQVFNQVGDFVRIEGFDRVDQLLAIHRLNQGLANAFVHLNENVAVLIALGEVPDRQSVILRQSFENVGDIGCVKPFENFLDRLAGTLGNGLGIRFIRIGLHRIIPLILLGEYPYDLLKGVGSVIGVARIILGLRIELRKALLERLLCLFFFEFPHDGFSPLS